MLHFEKVFAEDSLSRPQRLHVFTQPSSTFKFSSIFTQLVLSPPSSRKSVSFQSLYTCDLSNMQSERGEYFFLLHFERRKRRLLHGKLPLAIYGLPYQPNGATHNRSHIGKQASLPPSRGDEDIFWREKIEKSILNFEAKFCWSFDI